MNFGNNENFNYGNNNQNNVYEGIDKEAKTAIFFTWGNLPGLGYLIATQLIQNVQNLAQKILILFPNELTKKEKLEKLVLWTAVPTLLGAASTYILAGRAIYGLGVVVLGGTTLLQGATVGLVSGGVARVVKVILRRGFFFEEKASKRTSNIIGIVAGVAVSTLVLPGAAATALWINVAIAVGVAVGGVVGFIGLFAYGVVKDIVKDLYEDFGVTVGKAINALVDKTWDAGKWTLSRAVSLLPSSAAVAVATHILVGRVLMGTVLVAGGLTLSTTVPMGLIPVVISRVLNALVTTPNHIYQDDKKYHKTFVNFVEVLGRVGGVAVSALVFPAMLPTVLTISAVALGVDYFKLGDKVFNFFLGEKNEEEGGENKSDLKSGYNSWDSMNFPNNNNSSLNNNENFSLNFNELKK